MKEIKQKFNKLIILIMVLTFILPIFTLKVEANQITITDDLIIGSLINASQGGNSRGNNDVVSRLGNHVIGGQLDSGRRLGVTPKRGGGNVSWNPSLIDINKLYDDYTGFVVNDNIPQSYYTVPVNRTFNYSTSKAKNSRYVNGFIAIDPGYANQISSDHYDGAYMIINLPRPYKYVHVETVGINFSEGTQINNFTRSSTGDFGISNSAGVLFYNHWTAPHFNYASRVYGGNSYGVNLLRIYNRSATGVDDSWTVGNVYFSDYSSINLNNTTIIHNADEHPSRQEFIQNYTSTFRVQYNQNTNQLVENNSSYVYNLDDFSDNSTTINNTYVTNNYIDITEGGGEGGGNGGSEPPAVEEGKGFWTSLFDAISSIVSAFSDFISSVPQLILDLLDGLLGLVEKVVELFIPTSEQMQELSDSFSGLTDDLSLKFSPVTETMGSIKSVFSSPKSIYDLSYNYEGQNINVIPVAIEPEINKLKPLLNGAIVLSTFISIYKRFVGREDVIK